MSKRMLSLYSPFSLQLGSNRNLHRRNQQIIYYAESCFRVALVKISKSAHRHQQTLQHLLQQELVRGLDLYYNPAH